MPRSGRSPKQKPTTPDLSPPVAGSAAEAEALGHNIAFRWRGIDFVVDITAVKFGKAAFGIRVVANEALNPMVRMDAAVSVLEAAVGQQQLMKALEAAPDFFDDEQVISSFWEAYIEAVHGATPGESRAS